MYRYHIFFIHSSDNGQLGWFCILAIVNNVPIDIAVHLSFWIGVFVFVRYIPSSRISGSYDSSVCSFLRNLHSIFHSGCTNLHSHQVGIYKGIYKGSLLYFCQHFLFVVFLMVVIPTGMRCYLIVVLIWISWMICDVVHLFLWLLTICISSWEKCLFSSAHF